MRDAMRREERAILSGVEEEPGVTVLCCARRGKFFTNARHKIAGRGEEHKCEIGLGL